MTSSSALASSHTGDEPSVRSSREALVDRFTWGLAVANLVAQIGIIVTGGLVRVTGSGLGCSQWPMCEPGSFTPEFHAEMTFHPLIEFGNRTLTGVLGVVALLLVWAVYRRTPTAGRPASLRRLAWLPLAGIAVQAVIGGITVWVDLHPAIVGSHMLISLMLVAVSTYLLVRLGAPDGPPRLVVPAVVRPLTVALVALGVLLLVLGVVTTGAGPHSGDATEPYRWALDPAAISRLHAVAVWAFTAVAIVGLVLIRRAPGAQPVTVRPWWWLLAVTALQGVIGYVQYLTGLPELLVVVHMLGAALLVVALVHAVCALHTRAPQRLDANTAPA